MPTKTISIRIPEQDYHFLSLLSKEENDDLSKKIRELVDLGRVMLAIEKYKKGEASIEKAAQIAGLSIAGMLEVLKEYKVEANLEYEDYLKGLENLRMRW
jgi:predicted HTH domain antitoxin